MSYAQALKDLLEPLRVYRLEKSINGSTLTAVGEDLDQCRQILEEFQRKMLLATSQSWGLDRIESLLLRHPVISTLRIGGDSFTLQAINDNLKGCGLNAMAEENGTPGQVVVRFPDVPGVAKGFDGTRGIIEDILPRRLGIEYRYWYITWETLEKIVDGGEEGGER